MDEHKKWKDTKPVDTKKPDSDSVSVEDAQPLKAIPSISLKAECCYVPLSSPI